MKVTKKQFDRWVVEAIQLVPKRLLKKMHNLVFVVDDRPTRAQIKDCSLRRGYALFGLYQGYEQTTRKIAAKPDQITIFRRSIMAECQTPQKIRNQVFSTVWHEVSHHFGSDEEGAIRAEKRMFERYYKLNRTARVQKREVKSTATVRQTRRSAKRKSAVTFVVTPTY